VTFDAILKAGDNLQADYDQLHSQKEALHQQLVKLAQEKEEVAISFFLFDFYSLLSFSGTGDVIG
jgi:hypothetical protein